MEHCTWNAAWIFKLDTETGGLYNKMYSDNYEKWLSEEINTRLLEKSVLVVDNASCDNRILNMSSWKSQMIK